MKSFRALTPKGSPKCPVVVASSVDGGSAMAVRVNPKRQRVISVVAAVCLTNLLSWFAGLVYLGGDAVSGYVDDGSFYVGSHGEYTEVNEAAWHYSRVHTVLFIVSIPITGIFGFWATRQTVTGLKTSTGFRKRPLP